MATRRNRSSLKYVFRYKKANNKPALPFWLFSLFFLIIIIILASGYWVYRTQKNELRRKVGHDLKAVAQMKENQIIEWRNGRLNNAYDIISNIFLTKRVYSYIKTGSQIALRDILRELNSIKRDYNYNEVIVVDKYGNVIISTSNIHKNVLKHIRREIAKSFQYKEPAIVDLHLDTGESTPHMEIIAPLFDDYNKSSAPKAAVLLVINAADHLFPLMKSLPINRKTLEILLVRSERDHVLFLNDVRNKPGSLLRFRIPLYRTDNPSAMVILGKLGLFEGIDYRGERVISYLTSIINSPWYMVVKMDSSEAFAEMNFILLLIIIVILGLSASIIGIMLIIRQEIQKMYYLSAYEAEIDRKALLSHFNYVIKYANDIILLADKDFNIIEANDMSLEKYGYTRDEFLKLSLTDIIAPDDIDLFLKNANMLNMKGYFRKGVHIRKDGSIFPVEVSARSIEIEGRHYLNCIIRDITERKLAEEKIHSLNRDLETRVAMRTSELEASNRELESFSYSVSHDLRSPLRIIDGFSEMLEKGYANSLDDKAKGYINNIRSGTERMTQLIDDLLRLSRITRAEINRMKINLGDIVLNIADELRKNHPERNVVFDIDSEITVNADQALIKIAMENLVNNAWKFTGGNKTAYVEFGAMKANGRNVYFLRDDGAGFDMAYSARLFNPFQRLHNQRQFEGQGIGLAIVKRIIERHGGRIWAEGEVSKGAVFYFTLPD